MNLSDHSLKARIMFTQLPSITPGLTHEIFCEEKERLSKIISAQLIIYSSFLYFGHSISMFPQRSALSKLLAFAHWCKIHMSELIQKICID